MIYTVTLNPALDRAIVIDRLMEDDTIRVVYETVYAAGKGIDVSRVIKELGGQSIALGFVGGYRGLELEGLLINAGVMTDFITISHETRTNIILKERASGKQYVISAEGPEVSPAEIGDLYNRIRQLQSMDYLVMCGSLPKGATSNLYGQLIIAGKKKKAFVMIDTDGKALKEAVEFSPDAIKPNIHELSRLVDRELKDENQILDACETLHRKGIKYVIVSRGKEGLILSTPDTRLKAVAPPVEVDSTVGAGDSVVAGFILAHSQGKDLEECLRLACASGTATARTPGTELCHKRDVDELFNKVNITPL